MFRAFAFAALACSLALGTAPAAADSVADFYKGKTVSLIIGYSAGGGADLWARFIARHLGRHIPGNPNVIVQNMPGGSGLAAVNHVYNAVPQDGTRIILPSVSVPTAAAMGMPNVRWDTLKFNWLGNLARDAQSCVASGRSGIKSITDAREREIIFGSDGATNTTGQHPRLLATLFGYQAEDHHGLRGHRPGPPRDGERRSGGRVFGMGLLPSGAAAGRHRLRQAGADRADGHEKAPDLWQCTDDLRTHAEQTGFAAHEVRFQPGGNLEAACGGAGYAGGSGRRASGRVLGDGAFPELKADADKQQLVVDPMDWKETEAALREALAIPEDVVARARDMMK